jgi:hypothetical protein
MAYPNPNPNPNPNHILGHNFIAPDTISYRNLYKIQLNATKTLGDIYFKLETKIMNCMSALFENNIIKPTQVLSIICNAICLQFSLYRAPLQRLGLFLLISSCITDLNVILTKYHYIILTDYPGIQFHRYIS